MGDRKLIVEVESTVWARFMCAALSGGISQESSVPADIEAGAAAAYADAALDEFKKRYDWHVDYGWRRKFKRTTE